MVSSVYSWPVGISVFCRYIPGPVGIFVVTSVYSFSVGICVVPPGVSVFHRSICDSVGMSVFSRCIRCSVGMFVTRRCIRVCVRSFVVRQSVPSVRGACAVEQRPVGKGRDVCISYNRNASFLVVHSACWCRDRVVIAYAKKNSPPFCHCCCVGVRLHHLGSAPAGPVFFFSGKTNEYVAVFFSPCVYSAASWSVIPKNECVL